MSRHIVMVRHPGGVWRGAPCPGGPFAGERRSRGFTLIELAVVIAILAILATLGMLHFKSYIEKVRYVEVLQTLRVIEKELIAFNLEAGRFPDSLAEVGLAGLADPWGNNYRYLNTETAANRKDVRKNYNFVPVNTDFDLYSMGPDGASRPPFTAIQSRDDIVRADNGAFFGKVSHY